MAASSSRCGVNSSHSAVVGASAPDAIEMQDRQPDGPFRKSFDFEASKKSDSTGDTSGTLVPAPAPAQVTWDQTPAVSRQNTRASDDPAPNVTLSLTEAESGDVLGFSWPTWKKWAVLTAVFVVQLSMNFNASVYANGFHGITQKYGVSLWDAHLGLLLFLILYGIGSELWAPWSEELGRWPVLQGSLLLVNLTQVLCALAPNLATLLAGRCLGGLFSAGGSVTLGMVADLWGPDEQQHAISYVVLSSVLGSALGPVFGSLVETYLAVEWIFWVQLLFGATVQAIHFWVPETRVKVLLDREARRRREAGNPNVLGPGELKTNRLTVKKVLLIWYRPFYMFATEPIVLFLSLLSGFSDALIFTLLDSFGLVMEQWGFGVIQIGQSFWAVIIGCILGYLAFQPFICRENHRRRKNPGSVAPESRLRLLRYLVLLEPIGLLGFAWTGTGPPISFLVPLLFVMLIAIANYAIYMATIDYMVASYGSEYSASATGGNALARDVLAGLSALYAKSFYEHFEQYRLQLPSTILGILAVLVAIPVFVFYWKGAEIRKRSKMAESVEHDREEHEGHVHQRRAAEHAGGRQPAEQPRTEEVSAEV